MKTFYQFAESFSIPDNKLQQVKQAFNDWKEAIGDAYQAVQTASVAFSDPQLGRNLSVKWLQIQMSQSLSDFYTEFGKLAGEEPRG